MLAVDALRAMVPGTAAVSSSTIVTVTLAGVPSDAPPVRPDRVAVKVSLLSTAVSWAIDTTKVLSALSPAAQLNVPLAAV